MTASTGRVAAVVVTYEPELPATLATLERTARQAGRVLVVDNGSGDQPALAAAIEGVEGVELLALEDNLGIAAALNRGVALLLDGGDLDWVLTLDQDSVLHDGAITTALAALEGIEPDRRARCGVLGLRYPSAGPAPRALWRRAERALQVGEPGGGLRERRFLITSGNLVRREVAATVRYEEAFFIDQVDAAFSAAVRSAGWSLFEHVAPLMEHEVGRLVEIRGGRQRYEPGERLYYIVRNSTVLWRRRQLPAIVFAAQLVSWCRAYAVVNGARALPRGAAIVLAGLFDAVAGRMGRRRYAVLAEPPPRDGAGRPRQRGRSGLTAP